jgi:RNA polymerase sigma-70 factor (ECF subfamily)
MGNGQMRMLALRRRVASRGDRHQCVHCFGGSYDVERASFPVTLGLFVTIKGGNTVECRFMDESSVVTLNETGKFDLFAGLVREHQAGLRAYVRSLGVQDIWVDDLAQEAFLVAYRRYGDFRSGADYGKWLRGIARHLVANERRKEGWRSRLVHERITDLLLEVSTAEDPEPAPVFGQLAATMEDCVQQLAPHSRELLERRYAQAENASALARRFSTSAEAIRQSLRRIRLAVKECVERKVGEVRL